MLVKYESETVARAMRVGREKQFRPRPVAVAEMPTEHFMFDDWLFIPREQDTSIIPAEADRRVKELQIAAIPIVGQVVAHEAPKLLMAPKEPVVDWDEVKKKAKKGTMMAIATGVSVVTTVMMALGYGVIALFAGLVMIDPALLVVIEDPDTGEHIWLEVARWRE